MTEELPGCLTVFYTEFKACSCLEIILNILTILLLKILLNFITDTFYIIVSMWYTEVNK